MKKLFKNIILLTTVMSFMLSVAPANGEMSAEKTDKIVLKVGSTKMSVNGLDKSIDPGRETKPVIVNGRTLLPIRAVVEEMGGVVEWDAIFKSIKVLCNDVEAEVFIGRKVIVINGVEEYLDVEPVIMEGRTMIPLRSIIETIGGDITWNGNLRTIDIAYNYDKTLRGTIIVNIRPNSPSPEEDFNSILELFLKKNPKLTVKTKVKIDLLEDIMAESINSSGVDVVQIAPTWNGYLSQNDALMDLTQKYDQSKYLPQVLTNTILYGDSKVTSMPWYLDTKVLYYRKDACQKAGVNPQKDFDTWDSFKAALKKLNGVEIDGENISALGMPQFNDWNILHNLAPLIWGNGGDYLSSDNTKSIINSENSIRGIKFYFDLFHEGLIDSDLRNYYPSNVESLFVEGKFATTFGGSYMDYYKSELTDDVLDKVGVTLMPKGPEGRFGYIGGANLGVFKNSDNKKAALALLNYLASKEAQLSYAKFTGMLPATNEALEDDYIVNHPLKSKCKEMLKYGKQYPCVAHWNGCEVMFQDAFSKIFGTIYYPEYGDTTIKRFLDEATNVINKFELNID